jgi:hypothetical protein
VLFLFFSKGGLFVLLALRVRAREPIALKFVL